MKVEQSGFKSNQVNKNTEYENIMKKPYEAYWKDVKSGTEFLALSADPSEEDDGEYTKVLFRFFADGSAWFSDSMISGVTKKYDGYILISYNKVPSK